VNVASGAAASDGGWKIEDGRWNATGARGANGCACCLARVAGVERFDEVATTLTAATMSISEVRVMIGHWVGLIMFLLEQFQR
jgi:hypothetical protein